MKVIRALCVVLAAAAVAAGCSDTAQAEGPQAALLRSEEAASPATVAGLSPVGEPMAALNPEPVTTAPGDTAPVTTAPSRPDRAMVTLATLTLDQKVGQLFMPVLSGQDPTAVTPEEGQANRDMAGVTTPAAAVSSYHLGGILYLAKNVSTPDQVGQLSAGLQSVARADSGVGLLVAVDQEGGRVNRITGGVNIFPSAAVLSGDAQAAREDGYVTGRQVSGLGVNVVLAPVADVTRTDIHSFISNRSYGADPQVVANMVQASVDGLQDSGVAAAVKHWPGHGGTEVDSHKELPVLADVTRQSWDGRERLPFQAAINHHVDIVLVGHLAMPALDPTGTAATVSPVLIDGLLRHDLGFGGVVMTDALNMGAVANIDPGRLVVEAVLAGVDMLLVPPDLSTAYRALKAAVQSGEISAARLDQSVLRVLRLKESLGQLPPPPAS